MAQQREEKRRDSVDMFSKNNFNEELRNSISFESGGDGLHGDSIDEIIIEGGDTLANISGYQNNSNFVEDSGGDVGFFDNEDEDHPLSKGKT